MSTISSLAYKDLRGYLDAVDKLGELRVVNGADWDLELGAITEVAARASKPKVLLFDNIKGYPNGFRVVTNPVCSAATTALAFGLDPKHTGLDLIRAWKEKLGSQKPLEPVAVSNGPITENVDSGDKVDLLRFPTPRWHEHDDRHRLHGDHAGPGGELDQRRHLSRLCSRQKDSRHLDFAGQARLFDSGKILVPRKGLSGRDQLGPRSGIGESCELV